MDNSNINQLLNAADQALVDFSDSDLSGNVGDRSPAVISTHQSEPAQANPAATLPSQLGGIGGIGSSMIGFTDSMGDSLDSPDIPIRVPKDPIDSVSSSDMSRVQAPPSRLPVQAPPSRPPVQAPPSRQPVQSRPPQPAPRRMPDHRVQQTMRNIAARHQVPNGDPRPSQRQGVPQRQGSPQRRSSPGPAGASEGQGQARPPVQQSAPAPTPVPVQNTPDLDQGGIIDPNDPNVNALVDANVDVPNVPAIPDHMTSLMGYSIPTSTLYFILVLLLIAVGLYFLTTPPAPKEDKKKKKKDDEEEEEE
jgi:hypothetical protein